MMLIAVSRWLFSINRVTMATIDETILLTFLVFIFYTKAVKNGRYRDYLITGFLLGLGLHLHTGARVLPVIIGADILVRLVRDGKLYIHRQLKQVVCMIFLAVVVFLPMLRYIYYHRMTISSDPNRRCSLRNIPAGIPCRLYWKTS